MNVDHSLTRVISPGHSIEVGGASWDPEETSIRCRYDLENGRFSPHNSSELPLPDLRPLLEVASDNDLLSIEDSAAIISALSTSILRRSIQPNRVQEGEAQIPN